MYGSSQAKDKTPCIKAAAVDSDCLFCGCFCRQITAAVEKIELFGPRLMADVL